MGYPGTDVTEPVARDFYHDGMDSSLRLDRHRCAKVVRSSNPKKEESKMKDTLIAVDLAKTVFEIAVSEHPGKVAEQHRLSRDKFLGFFAGRQPSTVLLEACGSAHYWARALQRLGHRPVLLPPQLVRPYIPRNKTDRADTKGLLEASRNEKIKPVPVKSESQQTLGALHRLRSRWMADRIARLNTLRGLLREFGFFIPVGASRVVPAILAWIEDAESGLMDALREPLAEACAEIRELERRILGVERQLKALARQTPVVKRLQSIPGVGLLTSTALVAFVGDVQRFPSSRHFSSFLGLTPREYSTGNRRRLGRISKRGDAYLRMLLIHGARAVLWAAKRQQKPPDRLRDWALRCEFRRGHNKAAVALANKLARLVWAIWRRGTQYQAQPLTNV